MALAFLIIASILLVALIAVLVIMLVQDSLTHPAPIELDSYAGEQDGAILSENGDEIVIEWSSTDNSADTGFVVEIQSKGGEWYEVTDECNPDFVPSGETLHACAVSASLLLKSPFNLLYNDVVYSRVSNANQVED